MKCYVCNCKIEDYWYTLRKELWIVKNNSSEIPKGNHLTICEKCVYNYFVSKQDLTIYNSTCSICKCHSNNFFVYKIAKCDTFYILTSFARNVKMYENIFHTRCFEDASGIRLDIDNGD